MRDENLNETLERVFTHIEESAQGSDSENSFAGLFDDYDVNSNKLGSTVAKRNERLVKLLDGIAAMNLDGFFLSVLIYNLMGNPSWISMT